MAPQSTELATPEAPEEQAARRPMWELAECNCPDFCDRDHEQD